ncbi:glucosyltransferase domain-containing protein [Stenotrophomonas rhizophila]|uniref:glucosyltransferase domain-containing protein n=1 Tax=Stenotrophomonas sp. TWI819 TaxID=3136800 RepID=UPI00320BA961
MRYVLAMRSAMGSVPLSELMRGLWGLCAAVAVACILARLPFLIAPGLSIDSYSNLDGWPPMERFVSQGRFGQFLIFQAMQGMGVDPETFATLFQGVGLICFAFTAPLFFAAFDKPCETKASVVCLPALLLVLHPFQAEILTFSEASFSALLAIAMGIAAVFITARALHLWWLGCVLLVVALSMYQLVLNYVGIMVLLGLVRACLDGPGVDRPRWRNYLPAAAAGVTAALAVVLYLIVNKLFISVLGVPVDQRGQMISLDQLGARIGEIGELAKWVFSHPLLVPTASAVRTAFWAMVIGGWVVVCWLLLRSWRRETPIALLVVLISPLVGLGVVAVGATWWPVPRVLGGLVALFAAGCFWMCMYARNSATRASVRLLAGLLLISSIAIGHRIHNDQRQLNTFDAFLAEQIMVSLRGLDGYTEQTPIAVVNTKMRWTHGVTLATTWMDMNISAFYVSSAVPARMTLSTGRKLNFRQAGEEDVAACADAPAWPEGGFVSMQAGGALVCL